MCRWRPSSWQVMSVVPCWRTWHNLGIPERVPEPFGWSPVEPLLQKSAFSRGTWTSAALTWGPENGPSLIKESLNYRFKKKWNFTLYQQKKRNIKDPKIAATRRHWSLSTSRYYLRGWVKLFPARKVLRDGKTPHIHMSMDNWPHLCWGTWAEKRWAGLEWGAHSLHLTFPSFQLFPAGH